MAGRDDDLVFPETVPLDVAGQEQPAFRQAPPGDLTPVDIYTSATAGASPVGEAPADVELGRFVLGEELGRGGMGYVVSARDPLLRRTVAIKLMKPGRRSDISLERFVAEAQVTGQLDHPNIVPVHELGETASGEPWFAMKRVQGRSLAEVLAAVSGGEPGARQHWSRHRLLGAFVQICNAIAYAHDRRVLHRDLKPSNVMLGAFGEVLVMDWGVAGIMGEGAPPVAIEQATTLVPEELATPTSLGSEGVDRSTVAQTQEGATVGTPGYMSPEQTAGDLARLDGRSDVFALGAILYEVLTLRRAFAGPNLFAVVHALMSGPPVPPADRAPEEGIPAEIADIAMKALAKDREERYATAAALGAAVQAFLEGSRRRAEARSRLDSAREHRDRWVALRAETTELVRTIEALRGETPPWTGVSDKAELLVAEDRLTQIADEELDSFDAFVGACEAALSHDPTGPVAPKLLAEAWWTRLEQAERDGDTRFARHCANRVRAWDREGLSARLDAPGMVSLRTDPVGAEVRCQEVLREGLIWQLGPAISLGPAPLHRVALPQGSWVLTLSAPGCRDTVYPVHLTRAWHWDSGEAIPLYSEAQIGAGWRYVPAGPFVAGGDPGAEDSEPRSRPWLPGYFIAELPVLMSEWVEFVNALHAVDPAEAAERAPKVDRGGPSYWEAPDPGEPWVLPEEDRHGDRWDAGWPVFCVSHHDAVAFTEWRTRITGVPHALPTEHQWEKAGRGVDGRIYPWGDRFDATLCMMRDSGDELGYPLVPLLAPRDVSVYGVHDLSGGVHEWCSGESFDGRGTLRPVRGASWVSPQRWCRLASRFGTEPSSLFATYGVRLVRHGPLLG